MSLLIDGTAIKPLAGYINVKYFELFIEFCRWTAKNCVALTKCLRTEKLKVKESSSVLSHYTVHGILQARILEWVAFAFSRNVPNPGIEPRSPALQVNSLPAEAPGKPKNSGVGSLTLASRSSRPRNWTRVSYIAVDSFFFFFAVDSLPI